MPLQATSGAASYDAFGGGAAAPLPNYIEDVFSTWLYTGTAAAQTINNGIDLAGKGGLVWLKGRDVASNNTIADTTRGTGSYIYSNTDGAADTGVTSFITAFNATGFSLGSGSGVNQSTKLYTSWTFRKQPKFMDIATWTGDGASSKSISHALGSAPGCILVKRTDDAANWIVYHRSLASNQHFLQLNLTDAQDTSGQNWNVTSTTFSANSGAGLNASGAVYVAYLFAHDAGGFGLSGTDNVISCGSFTTNGSSAATVTLGYEPQWILTKRTDGTGAWGIYDTMRGWSFSGQNFLLPNSSGAEGVINAANFVPTATGFTISAPYDASGTYIYIAIRRGPMKVPTTGTSVFAPVTATAPSSPYTVTTNFPVDLTINATRNSSSGKSFNDRLRGGTTNSYVALDSTNTSAEAVGTGFGIGFQSNTSIVDNGWQSGTGNNPIYWNFRRAPGFFDEVCYTGTGVARTVTHNLAAVPEMMIVKSRSLATTWAVYAAPLGNTKAVYLDQTSAEDVTSRWNNTTPTSTVFSVNNNIVVNDSGATYVAYLFASCPGVSKVGSYTGNGSSQTINCGFTGGARFVMIKRTDSTGDWYVWDTARGIVSGNDPHLSLNTTAAEVTSNDTIDTDSTGFVVNQVSATNVNVSSATYIFLAIA